MNKKLIKGFTLAETLIVIIVLGIIAMLTVPNVIRQYMEAVARTKIKKSMTVYDMAITKMTVENDLRSDTELIKWSKEVDNCGNTVTYFKTANNKSCEFKTSDGVWWDISDIMNPIIALSIDDLHTAQAEGINGKTSFKLVASFDRQSGAFRVDDIGYEKLKLEAQLALAPEEQPEDVQDNIEELELLLGFIDNKNDNKNKDDNNLGETEGQSCASNDIVCLYKRGDTLPPCGSDRKSCVYTSDFDEWGTILQSDVFDESGNRVVYYRMSPDSKGGFYKSYESNDIFPYLSREWSLDSQGNIYKSYEYMATNTPNEDVVTKWSLDSQGNIYKSYEQYNNNDEFMCRTYYNPDGSISSQDGNACTRWYGSN